MLGLASGTVSELLGHAQRVELGLLVLVTPDLLKAAPVQAVCGASHLCGCGYLSSLIESSNWAYEFIWLHHLCLMMDLRSIQSSSTLLTLKIRFLGFERLLPLARWRHVRAQQWCSLHLLKELGMISITRLTVGRRSHSVLGRSRLQVLRVDG